MENIIASQLQHFAAVGQATFTGYFLMFLAGLFLLLATLLCKQAFAMQRILSLLLRSFSEPAIQSSTFFRLSWEEYSNTFFNDLHGNYKTTAQASVFFDAERHVSDALGLRWWRFVPAVFFALGMIMLLVQLVYGLIGFDLSSTDAVMASLEHAFMALANAMVCIGAAILLSLLSFFMLRLAVSALKRRMRALAAMLDRRYLISTLQEREITLAEYAKTLTRIVNSLFAGGRGSRALTPGMVSRQLADQAARTNLLLQKVAEREVPDSKEIGAETGKAIAEALGPELKRLMNAMENYERQASAPAQLTTALQDATRSLQRSISALQEEQDARIHRSQGPKQ